MNQGMFAKAAVAAAIALAFTTSAGAQEISADAISQMNAISAAKGSLTPAQQKMDSKLVFGIYKATGDARVASFTNAIAPLSESDATQPTVFATGVPATASSSVTVEIKAPVSDDLNAAIAAAGGSVIFQSAQFASTTVALPVSTITSIAGRPDVVRVKLPASPSPNVGALTSQGYVTHASNKEIANLHYDGTGVTVGVLSDSASTTRIAALIASGDLAPGSMALPGQNGPTAANGGTDEGAAMMEIVHDMAPGAKILFATAYSTEAQFAANIIALAQAGCKVIVDDVGYSDEFPFQDSIISQAVNTVTTQYGVTYFSSAANSGALTKGTSGTWEGDFLDGGAVPTGTILTGEAGKRFHNFGTAANPQNYDTLTVAAPYVDLFWSDPIGQSSNDYDLFILNSTGTTVVTFSSDTQTGAGSDPIEEAYTGTNFPVGSRIVIVKSATAAPRAFHLDTNRGALSIATTGSTHGHGAAANTVSTAATYWNSGRAGAKPFTGQANTTETFSSDGPRKIFYNPDGSPITAGNFLFATSGGTTLQKPDLTAADGVATKTPGFNPFFGTSAAAPHAAAIAALVLSAKPNYTPAQVKAAMTSTALPAVGAAPNRDAGYGIAMADAAVQYALQH